MNYVPGFLLMLLISMAIGLFVHLWRGGSVLRMLVLVLITMLGFMMGHWIGQKANSTFLVIGWVQLGWGVILAVLAALVGAWLTEIKIET